MSSEEEEATTIGADSTDDESSIESVSDIENAVEEHPSGRLWPLEIASRA